MEDFRTLLEEVDRDDIRGRWFKDIRIGNCIFMSVQASHIHLSEPAETLDNVYDYNAFEVGLATQKGMISDGVHGVWIQLHDRPWADRFEAEAPYLLSAGAVPVEVVQQIYEDLIEYEEKNPSGVAIYPKGKPAA